MNTVASISFNDAAINWRTLGDLEHFQYTIFAVDAENEIVDFCLKLTGGERIFPHRHRAFTYTFVAHGEHLVYETDGSLRETRATGSFTAAPASMEPHQEGGGDTDAIVVYNTRGSDKGVVFEVLDDAGATVGTLTMSDFQDLFALQGGVAGA